MKSGAPTIITRFARKHRTITLIDPEHQESDRHGRLSKQQRDQDARGRNGGGEGLAVEQRQVVADHDGQPDSRRHNRKNLNLVHEVERALQFGAMTGRHQMRESRPVNSAKPGHDQCDRRRRNEVARGEQRDRFRSAERRQQNGARKRRCGEVEREIAKVGDAGELPDTRWRRDRVQRVSVAGGSVRMCLMTATLAATAMTMRGDAQGADDA